MNVQTRGERDSYISNCNLVVADLCDLNTQISITPEGQIEIIRYDAEGNTTEQKYVEVGNL